MQHLVPGKSEPFLCFKILTLSFFSCQSYFVKLNKDDASPLNSTWSKPVQFARLVRQHSNHA